MENINESKVEKLKAHGYYDNLVSVLKINPKFELHVVTALMEPSYSTYGAQILATTKINQLVLITILEKNLANILIEILNFNLNFTLTLKGISVLDDKVLTLLGAELISKIDTVSSSVYYDIITASYGMCLCLILKENPHYFNEFPPSMLYHLSSWEYCTRFWGPKITSHLPFNSMKDLADSTRSSFSSYGSIKEMIEDDPNAQLALISKLNELCSIKEKIVIGDPRDCRYDSNYLAKATGLEYSIAKFLDDIISKNRV